jgi:hypothetical protein
LTRKNKQFGGHLRWNLEDEKTESILKHIRREHFEKREHLEAIFLLRTSGKYYG